MFSSRINPLLLRVYPAHIAEPLTERLHTLLQPYLQQSSREDWR